MKRLLKLQHHRHTAKKLQHKHTSYRALILVLLITGLSITYIQKSSASDYQVTANIQAVIPNQPAVILSPLSGTSYDHNLITISGNCPVTNPAILISIWRKNQVIGTAQCDEVGTYRLSVTLLPGINVLVPKVVTVTGGEGKEGAEITVTYNAPVSETTKTTREIVTNAPDASATPSQLILTSNVSYVVFSANSTVLVDSIINGGVKPYNLTVDWGDGNIETLAIDKTGSYTHSHKYLDTLTRRITFRVFDSANNSALLQITAVNLARPLTVTSPLTYNPRASGFISVPKSWFSYGVITITALGFWAGQIFEQGRLMAFKALLRKFISLGKG